MEYSMQHIVITLVFSIVMLFFMLYPSMVIVEFISKHMNICWKGRKNSTNCNYNNFINRNWYILKLSI